MAKTLKIDVYTDIICPWCLIGGRRLDNVLATELGDVDIDIEHHPVLLMPDCPDGGMDKMVFVKARYGDIDTADMRARPEAEARMAGLELDLRKQAMFYPTVDAHTLIRHARPRGTQHGVARAVFAAYFIDAQDISDPDVLADIAVQHGFKRDDALQLVTSPVERDATRQAAVAAASRGVRSVPTFVINGQAAQPQDEAALATLIHAALAPA